MFFADRLTPDKPRRTKEGYLGVRARSARSGIYQYLGRELDPQGTRFQADEIVNVYRPPEEVFDPESLGSFVGKPITDNHPNAPVTSDNWRQLARGTIMGAVKEGEYVGFDLAFLDASAVDAIDEGKRELSNGYESELVFEDGITSDGQRFSVKQVKIRGNHIALVEKGRAGPTCRIGDAAICESIPRNMYDSLFGDSMAGAIKWLKAAIALHEKHMNGTAPTTGKAGEKSQKLMMRQMENALAELEADGASMKMDGGETYSADDLRDKNAIARRETSDFEEGSQVATKTIQFDGLPVEATDAAEAVIRKLEAQAKSLADAKAEVDTKVGELTATVSAKDGEIAALNQKLKDAEIGPDKLQQMVADRSALIEKAKAIDPKVVTDGKSDADIRKAVVTAKLGDAAKDFDDNAIIGAFAGLTRDAKNADPVRKVISDGAVVIGDTASIRDAARNSRYAK